MGSTAYELLLQCRNLRDTDFLSKSDPYVKVEQANLSGHFTEIGRTEVVRNCLKPNFLTKVNVMISPNTTDRLRFVVMDEDVGLNDHLGETTLSMQTILASPNGA